MTNVLVPAQDLSIGKDIEDDEENLFEEEKKLNLIDPEEMVADESSPVLGPLDGQTDQEALATATLQSPQVKDDAPTSAPQKARPPQKKKKPAGLRRDPDRPVIMVLDSLGSMHSNATRALREWLEAEGVERRGMTVEIDHRGHYPKSAQIPMQSNFSDCGLYVLGYARKFFADPDEFKNRLLRGEMSSEADWPDMDASKMRSDIRNLILRLYEEQKGAGKAKKAAKAKSAVASPKTGDKDTSIHEHMTNVTEKDAPATLPPAARDQLHVVAAASEATTRTMTDPRTESGLNTKAGAGKGRACAVQDSKEDLMSAAPQARVSLQKATVKARPAPSKAPTVKQNKNPEVRVAAKSPSVEPSSHAHLNCVGDRSRLSKEKDTNLSSPLRKHGLQSTRDGRPHTLSAKEAQIPLPARTTPKGSAPTSPLQLRTRSGSHDDPIPLDDSQDLDAPSQRQFRLSKAHSADIIELDRSQETISEPAGGGSPAKLHPHFDRDDSIQEGFGNEWQEGRDVGRALKASLRGQQAGHEDRSGASNNVETPYEVPGDHSPSSHSMEGILEAQAMDIDDDDDDDAEVPESPEQHGDSPGHEMEQMQWQLSPV